MSDTLNVSSSPQEPISRGSFVRDDYEEVNRDYFDDIIRSRSWSALPAGWHNPHSDGAEAFSPRIPDKHNLQRYSVDEGHALGELKQSLLRLASKWERHDLDYDEVTICPSVSTANLTVLCALKKNGFDTIVFESPSYFATLQQAELLGFNCIRVPSFREDSFLGPPSLFKAVLSKYERCVLWITQPRFALGINQQISRLQEFGEVLGRKRLLVVDEAAEQLFPSVISSLGSLRCPVLRTRGLVKGTGLNGLRVSFVLHPPDWRARFEDILEAAGASLDRFSLENAALIADTPMLLQSMLAKANEQVCRERKKLEVMCLGSWIEPTALENSYIGSLLLDLNVLSGSYEQKRKSILTYCRDQRMPVILSASIGFAFDERCEGVRINYFTPSENIETAARILLQAPKFLS